MSEKRTEKKDRRGKGRAPKNASPANGDPDQRTGFWIGLWRLLKWVVETIMILKRFIAGIAAIVLFVIWIVIVVIGFPPDGLILFEASQWYENTRDGRTEILQKRKPNTPPYVELRKVGIGIPDANVERDLTYKKLAKKVLEIDYTTLDGNEYGVHFLIVDVAGGPPGVAQLNGYEDGYVFLRMRRMPRDASENIKGPPLTFRPDLRQGDDWFQGAKPQFAFQPRWGNGSGWWDLWIPMGLYWDRMKAISGPSKEPTLKQFLMIFGDRYGSPPEGRYWLNTIRFVEAKEMKRHTRRWLYKMYEE